MFKPSLTQDLCDRLNVLTNYKNSTTNTFALAQLPPSLSWGEKSGVGEDASSFVCINGKPVKVWVVAEIKLVWFFNPDGHAYKRSGLCFQPMLLGDYDRAREIELNFSKPTPGKPLPNINLQGTYISVDLGTNTGVWANKWLASKSTRDEDVGQLVLLS